MYLYCEGRLSLSTVGDKCAKDNFGGDFIKSFNKFQYTNIHIITAVKCFSLSEYTKVDVA